MRGIHLLLCVGIAGTVGVSVFGQTDKESTFGDARIQPAPTAEAAEAEEEAVFGPDDEVLDDVQALRLQYLQLTEQKSQLMDRDALNQAIQGAGLELEELTADEKLQQARQQLLELMKAHPETRAARQARVMLQSVPDKTEEFAPFRDDFTFPNDLPRGITY